MTWNNACSLMPVASEEKINKTNKNKQHGKKETVKGREKEREREIKLFA